MIDNIEDLNGISFDFNPVHPKDIKKGDILLESGQYGSIEFEALNNPTKLKC